MVRRCGRGLPFLSVTRGRRIRNLSWNEIGQSTCRDNRKHGDTCHDEEAKLQCKQARIRVDAHRLLDLLREKRWWLPSRCRSRSLLTKFMLSRSTCDWISGGNFGFSAMVRRMAALSSPTRSAPATAVPTAAAKLLVVPRREPTSPASSLGEEVTSTLNKQRDQRSLPDAENHEPDENRDRAPVVVHDKGQPEERNRAEHEAIASDLPWCQPAVKSHDQHRREENREVERQHGYRSGDRRAPLHDLDVERNREIEHRLQRDDGKHGIDRSPLHR